MRALILSLLSGLLLAPVAGCAGGGTGDAPTPPGPPPPLPAVDCVDLPRSLFITELGTTALRQEFGAPDSVPTVVLPSERDGVVQDTFFAIYYPGLAVSGELVGGGRELIWGAVVSSNRYLRYPEIGIGASAELVTRVLGRPSEAAGDTLVYDCGTGPDEPVTFYIRDGTVARIEVSYYIG